MPFDAVVVCKICVARHLPGTNYETIGRKLVLAGKWSGGDLAVCALSHETKGRKAGNWRSVMLSECDK